MDLVFIRHGHYGSERYATRAGKQAAPLTLRGEEQARAAGMYLAEHGIRPDVVLHTRSRRTRQTAELVLEELGMGGHPVFDIGTSFRSVAGLEAKLRTWSVAHGLSDDAVVFLVGHGPAQDILRTCFSGGTPPPRSGESHAAALVLRTSLAAPPEGRGFFVGVRG